MKSLSIAVCLSLLATSAFAQTAQNSGSPDQSFMTTAAQGGMAEVMLGKLARTQASSPDVKKFGQRMVKDHTTANKKLMKIAKLEGVTLPTQPSDEDQQTYTRLSQLSGTAFDQAYVADMVQDHQKDINEFQQEANSGSDPRVRAFASATLPTLQMHLKMAQSLPGASNATANGGSSSQSGTMSGGSTGQSNTMPGGAMSGSGATGQPGTMPQSPQ